MWHVSNKSGTLNNIHEHNWKTCSIMCTWKTKTYMESSLSQLIFMVYSVFYSTPCIYFFPLNSQSGANILTCTDSVSLYRLRRWCFGNSLPIVVDGSSVCLMIVGVISGTAGVVGGGIVTVDVYLRWNNSYDSSDKEGR